MERGGIIKRKQREILICSAREERKKTGRNIAEEERQDCIDRITVGVDGVLCRGFLFYSVIDIVVEHTSYKIVYG